MSLLAKPLALLSIVVLLTHYPLPASAVSEGTEPRYVHAFASLYALLTMHTRAPRDAQCQAYFSARERPSTLEMLDTTLDDLIGSRLPEQLNEVPSRESLLFWSQGDANAPKQIEEAAALLYRMRLAYSEDRSRTAIFGSVLHGHDEIHAWREKLNGIESPIVDLLTRNIDHFRATAPDDSTLVTSTMRWLSAFSWFRDLAWARLDARRSFMTGQTANLDHWARSAGNALVNSSFEIDLRLALAIRKDEDRELWRETLHSCMAASIRDRNRFFQCVGAVTGVSRLPGFSVSTDVLEDGRHRLFSGAQILEAYVTNSRTGEPTFLSFLLIRFYPPQRPIIRPNLGRPSARERSGNPSAAQPTTRGS